MPEIASCSQSLAWMTGRRSQRSRSSARCILRGRFVYRHRAHGAWGRESRIAPTTSSGVMNMPTNPVHTFPLSSTITASANVSTAVPITSTRAATESSSRQMVTSKNDSGLKPRISRPATATATNTASTDARPSSDQ